MRRLKPTRIQDKAEVSAAAPSEPRPLRVGDRVRLIGCLWAPEFEGTEDVIVEIIDECAIDSGGAEHYPQGEGKEWERVA